MKKTFLFVLSFLFLTSLTFAQVMINEVDADTPGTDAVEFIELYDGGVGNTALDGLVVVLFNGSDDLSYNNAIDLDTYTTNANGYFVIGSATVPNVDLVAFTTNGVQNGADAVALYTGDAVDFPNDTAITLVNLIDALVYDTNDSDDAALLALLNAGEPQKNEDENGDKDTSSNQRIPNGSGGLRNTTTYNAVLATPGTQNPDPPASASIVAAYTLSSTEMDVVYDLSMTAVNASDYSLSGTSAITFSGAAIDGTDDTIVHLTGGSAAMTTDLVLDNIDDTITNLDFYAGIMPISNANTTNPTRATMLDGYYATFQGIISANDEYNNVWMSDAVGAYNGVLVYSSSFDGLVAVGDEVLVAGQRDIYNSLTELVSPVLLNTISIGNTPYGPDVIPAADIEETIAADTNPGESWEGQLVTISCCTVESTGNYYYRCYDINGDYFYVGDNVDYQLGNITMVVGQSYQVTGVVDWYNSGPYYRINPRDAVDIIDTPPCPVTLSSFYALYSNQLLTINWATESEVNNMGWNIYRSEINSLEQAIQVNEDIISGYGSTSEPHHYSYTDISEIENNTSYWYWLESSTYSGETEVHGPVTLSVQFDDDPIVDLPTETELFGNYPNPFNPVTEIKFNVKENETAKLTIYDVKGRVVANVTYGHGEHSYSWEANTNASGVYYYKLESSSHTSVKKMLLLK